MSLYTKIKLYLKANSKTWDDAKVSLQNNSDGNGDFISSWSYDIAKPTDEQLATYNSSATTEENNNVAISNRLNEYPSIGDIADAIFKKEAGDATEFNSLATKRQATKDKYPKE
tara:strand:- start:91 stop:432 length:342 start_codon:yes stop_codon:yes gene_type:complete